MSLQILISFLPWILLSALFGRSIQEMIVSVSLAALIFLCVEWRNLRKGFVLAWGTLLFLIYLIITLFVYKSSFVVNNFWFVMNVAIGVIIWISIFINKPFTLQYARERTAPQIWSQPNFYRINFTLTLLWGIIFLITSVIIYKAHNFFTTTTFLNPKLSNVQHLYQIILYASIALGIWLTKIFPSWYRRQSQKRTNRKNLYLQGNFAAIADESDINPLPIRGKIPPDLRGVYVRNGPNPAFEPISYTYPFDGDGMLHAIYLNDDGANYRNRYVNTKSLALEKRLEHAIYGGIATPIPPDSKLLSPNDDPGPIKNGAFINVIHHANRTLALWEGGAAYEVDMNLNTVGEWCPGTTKPLEVGPHTRKDPDTGDLYFNNYNTKQAYLYYYCINSQGILSDTKIIEKQYVTMLHDFALTKNYFIIFDCPVIYNAKLLEQGINPLQWQENLGTRIGVTSRSDAHGGTLWLSTAAFFVYHFVNAYEEEHTIFVDYVRHNRFCLTSSPETTKQTPKLYRMSIDLNGKSLNEKVLCNEIVEFPTYNQDYTGKDYQFIYAPTKLRDKREFNGVIKYDIENNKVITHDFGDDAEIGEVTFATKANAKTEDDGYLMLFVYHRKTNTSDFVILDAKDITAEPLTIISLPRRVPHGLHGSWIPKPNKS